MGADRDARRPWFVIVTGEPGAGKTSLGRQLAGALRVPFIGRDQVRGGLLATAGLWTGRLDDAPPREAAVEAFVALVETMGRLGVSAVLEFVVTPERVDAFRRIEAAGDVAVVLVRAANAAGRVDRRDRADLLLNRPEVLEVLGYDSIDDYLAGPERAAVRDRMQHEFAHPLLPVAADDGYDPPLETIVDWVIDRTRT